MGIFEVSINVKGYRDSCYLWNEMLGRKGLIVRLLCHAGFKPMVCMVTLVPQDRGRKEIKRASDLYKCLVLWVPDNTQGMPASFLGNVFCGKRNSLWE